MDLKIKGLRYENIREFQDVEIDLTNSDGSPHHISLIQMPNGTGKTTTMELIRIILLGQELDEDHVMTFQPSEFDAIEGSFEIDLESDGDQFTLRLELDYETGDQSYRHIRPREVGGGDTAGHFLPNQLKTVITESFVDLFVFNGELTQDFIETGSDEAENALKIVNYLNRLETQKRQIQDEVEARQEDQSVTTEQGYKNIQTRLKNTKQRYDELQTKIQRLEGDINDHNEKISSLKDDRRDILAKNEEQLERDKELESDIHNLNSDIETITDDLHNRMKHPSRLNQDFNDDMEDLLDNMEIMKLPKPTSKEFFNELAERPNCICGREITKNEQEVILDNADRYLTEEDIGVLNTLKERLRSIPEYEDYDDTFEKLEKKRSKLEQKKQEKARIGHDLGDPDLNEKLQKITEEIEDEEHERDRKKKELRRLTTNDKNEQSEFGLDWKNNIHICRRKKEQRIEELREASNTVNFGKKADILEKIFEDFIDQFLESLKQNQIDETNKKLEQILGLSKVQVEDIDNSIIIEGREDISEGQSLSIAYAYLSTLFEDSAIDVPFVIDSPAVSIDYDKRAQVAPIISSLFDQLIIFVISPERERFVNELESDDIHYCTIHKTDTLGEIEKHLDKDFFMDFQSEEERKEVV